MSDPMVRRSDALIVHPEQGEPSPEPSAQAVAHEAEIKDCRHGARCKARSKRGRP